MRNFAFDTAPLSPFCRAPSLVAQTQHTREQVAKPRVEIRPRPVKPLWRADQNSVAHLSICVAPLLALLHGQVLEHQRQKVSQHDRALQRDVLGVAQLATKRQMREAMDD